MTTRSKLESQEQILRPSGPGAGAGFGIRISPEMLDLGRHIVFIVGALVLSVGLGLMMVVANPLIAYGLVLGGFGAIVVLRWPYAGLLIYLVVYLLRIGELYPVLAPLRLERMVGMLTILSVVLAQIQANGRIALDFSRQTRQLLWLLLAAAASIPLSYWKGGAITGFIDLTKIVIFYFLIVQLINSRRRFWIFLGLYCSLICHVAYLSVSVYLTGPLLVAQGIDRAIGVTSAGGGPNELGATMATSLPLFILLTFEKRLGGWRFVFGAGLLLLAITLMLTGSRGGLLGFLTGMGYIAWTSRHRVIVLMLSAVVLAAAFTVMPDQYKGRYETLAAGKMDGSSNERIKVWTKGLHMFIDRPLSGVGINNFGTANAIGYSSGPRASWLESHSLYVQIPAEMGIVGAIAFFGYLFQIMRLNRKTAKTLASSDDDTWALERTVLKGMFAGFVALLITGVFGHSLMRITWYLYGALGLAAARVFLIHTGRIQTDAARELLD